MLASAHGHLADGNLAGLAQRLADHRIAFARLLVGGQKIIGALVIALVDLGCVDELHQVDGALAFEADGLELLGLEQDVSVALDLVTLHDVGGLDPADAGDGALIFDTLAGRFVNLVEPDLGLRFNSRIKLDRNGDEGQAQRALQ